MNDASQINSFGTISTVSPPGITVSSPGIAGSPSGITGTAFCLNIFLCGSAFAEEEAPVPLPEAKKEIVKVTEQGLAPANLIMAVPDGTIFLVNFAQAEPMNVEIEFGARRIHCHSKNLELDSVGLMRTVKPVGPQDFAVLCFPEKGVYPYTVLLGGKQRFKGTITVQ